MGGSYVQYTPTQLGTYVVVAYILEHELTGRLLPGKPSTNVNVNDTSYPPQATQLTSLYSRNNIGISRNSSSNAILDSSNKRTQQKLVSDCIKLAMCGMRSTDQDKFRYSKGPESAHVMWTRPYGPEA